MAVPCTPDGVSTQASLFWHLPTAGSIGKTPFACVMGKGGEALGAPESPPDGFTNSCLTYPTSSRLSARLPRKCNRKFVCCFAMNEAAYLCDALSRRLYLAP